MTIINFIKDLIFFIKIIFNKAEKIYFVENKKLIKYLDYYISNDLKKRNSIALISFDNFEDYYKKFNKKYIFKTNFFQQLFFLTLKAKYVITTTPDLGYTVFKKSLFAKVKYIYIQHSPFSLSHIYNKEAFINFDTIETNSCFKRFFCIIPSSTSIILKNSPKNSSNSNTCHVATKHFSNQ